MERNIYWNNYKEKGTPSLNPTTIFGGGGGSTNIADVPPSKALPLAARTRLAAAPFALDVTDDASAAAPAAVHERRGRQ